MYGSPVHAGGQDPPIWAFSETIAPLEKEKSEHTILEFSARLYIRLMSVWQMV